MLALPIFKFIVEILIETLGFLLNHISMKNDLFPVNILIAHFMSVWFHSDIWSKQQNYFEMQFWEPENTDVSIQSTQFKLMKLKTKALI